MSKFLTVPVFLIGSFLFVTDASAENCSFNWTCNQGPDVCAKARDTQTYPTRSRCQSESQRVNAAYGMSATSCTCTGTEGSPPISAARTRAQIYFDTGLEKYNRGDYLGCISDYAVVLDQSPANSAAIYNQALCYKLVDNRDRARSQMNNAWRIEKKPLYKKALADMSDEDGNFDRCVAEARDAIAANNRYHPAWERMSLCYLSLERFPDARAAADNAIRYGGQNEYSSLRMSIDFHQQKWWDKQMERVNKDHQLGLLESCNNHGFVGVYDVPSADIRRYIADNSNAVKETFEVTLGAYLGYCAIMARSDPNVSCRKDNAMFEARRSCASSFKNIASGYETLRLRGDLTDADLLQMKEWLGQSDYFRVAHQDLERQYAYALQARGRYDEAIEIATSLSAGMAEELVKDRESKRQTYYAAAKMTLSARPLLPPSTLSSGTSSETVDWTPVSEWMPRAVLALTNIFRVAGYNEAKSQLKTGSKRALVLGTALPKSQVDAAYQVFEIDQAAFENWKWAVEDVSDWEQTLDRTETVFKRTLKSLAPGWFPPTLEDGQ